MPLMQQIRHKLGSCGWKRQHVVTCGDGVGATDWSAECMPRRVGGRNVADDLSFSRFSFAFSPAEYQHAHIFTSNNLSNAKMQISPPAILHSPTSYTPKTVQTPDNTIPWITPGNVLTAVHTVTAIRNITGHCSAIHMLTLRKTIQK